MANPWQSVFARTMGHWSCVLVLVCTPFVSVSKCTIKVITSHDVRICVIVLRSALNIALAKIDCEKSSFTHIVIFSHVLSCFYLIYFKIQCRL